MSEAAWISAEWDKGTPVWHAQKLAREILAHGVYLDAPSGSSSVRYADVVQAFADAADDAITQHALRQKEKAAHIDAHEGRSQVPTDSPETAHRVSARSMRAHFFDGSDFWVPMSHPIVQKGGWKVRNINGVNMLIIGHGVPRKMIPLCNVKYFDLED